MNTNTNTNTTNTHVSDRQRVVDWLAEHASDVGAGDDPIGFILASYDLKIAEMNQMQATVASLEAIVNQSRKTCGRGNCNCVGSHKVKQLVNEYDAQQPTQP